MNLSPWPIKALPKALAGATIFILLVVAKSTNVQGADVAPGTFAATISAYNSGDFPSAEADLLALAKGKGSLDEKMQARFFLADICLEAEDFPCVFSNNSELLNQISELADKKQQASYWAQASPSFIEQFLVSPQFAGQDIPKLLDLWNHVPVAQILPEKYLMLQTAAIDYYGLQLDYAPARRSIARLIARAIVLPPRYYLFPRYLAEIIAGLTFSRDQNRAILMAAKFDGLIRGGIPKPSPTLIRYLEVTAALEGDIASPTVLSDGLSRLADAETQIHSIKLSESWKSNELARVAIQRTELLILKNDLGGAIAAHKANPLQAARGTIQKRGGFSSDTEMNFALLDLFLDKVSNAPLDHGWAASLSARQAWETGHPIDATFEAYRKFGLALVGEDDTTRAQMLHESAAGIVKQFDQSLIAHAGTFPLPDFVERIILSMELGRLSRTSEPTPEEKNFIVRAVDVLQRDIYHARGDSLYVMAELGSENLRRIEHTQLLLDDRRNELEAEALVSYGQETPSSPTANGQSDQISQSALDARAALVDLDRQLQDSTAALQKSESKNSTTLPDYDALQQTIGDGEAVVSEAAFPGTAFEICVGPRGDFQFVSKTIPDQFRLNLKIVRDALTASNPPSIELDKQYPVQAAIQLNQVLLGGLDRCLSKAKHVYYSPIFNVADIPLAALLSHEPPKDGDGYDLSKADWLINNRDFSYESSVEEFVAARKLSALAGGDLPFLGIGDPDLSKPMTDGKTAGEMLAMRGAQGANGAIATLPNLPDTAQELKEVAGLIPASQLLLGDNATEEQFERLPIGDYDLIEFATHGLISGELDGINEPGLVLTPVAATDTDEGSSGFLSSSQLSKLALRARLVVLSACNTANFEVDKFAGSIRGLTASLALSGVPTVIASLWPVESNVSKKLITSFYSRLTRDGARSISAAFADSLRDFLKAPPSSAFLHPRFWAAFTVYGDGGNKLLSSGTKPLRSLLQFDPSKETGAFSALAAGPKGGEYFDTRSGDWDGTRLASLIEKRSLTGSVLWKYEDRKVGTGPIVVGRAEILSAGYISSDSGRHLTPVLRAFTFAGKPLWEKTFDEGDLQAVVEDLAVSQSGDFWAVVRADVYSGADIGKSSLHILDISPMGEVIKDWSVELDRLRSRIWPERLLAAGDRVYIFSATGSKLDAVSTDDFGQSRYCSTLMGTNVFMVGAKDAQVKDLGLLRNVIVRFAGIDSGRFLVAGTKTGPCSDEGMPLLGDVTAVLSQQASVARADGIPLTELYIGEGLGGSLTGFAPTKRGLAVFGNVIARTSEFKSIGTDTSVKRLTSGLGYERSDAFVGLLDPHQAGTTDIHFIDAGTNTYIEGVSTAGDDLIIAGEVGFHPLWARYSLH